MSYPCSWLWFVLVGCPTPSLLSWKSDGLHATALAPSMWPVQVPMVSITVPGKGCFQLSLLLGKIFEMIWNDMTWYEMIWYEIIWTDMKWYEMIWNDLKWYERIWHDMKWYEMIWHDMKLYDMTWHDMIWNDMIWNETSYTLQEIGDFGHFFKIRVLIKARCCSTAKAFGSHGGRCWDSALPEFGRLLSKQSAQSASKILVVLVL